MNAVKQNKKFELRWPVESKNPSIKEEVNAKELWDEICQAAWQSAEPGILFWDNILSGPADCYDSHKTVSTNPCSELPLCPGDSCRLMLLNLTSFVSNPFTKDAQFDFNKLGEVAQKAQKLMDDLVDIEIDHINKFIKEKTSQGRRTGLGITGLGDVLASLNVRYGSQKSIEIAEEIHKCIAVNSYISSCEMARDRGAFPIFNLDKEKDNEFIKRIVNSDKKLKALYLQYGRRNIANTTISPAGSVSVLTQTTSGVEPAFLLRYTRRKKITSADKNARVDFTDASGDQWQEYEVYHHWFKKWMDITGKNNIEDSPYHKATSNEIDWVSSVKLQAAAQRWVCHAISKTCNLPNDVDVNTVKKIYLTAWESGCKGFTIYRDGCRNGVLVAEKKQNKDERPREIVFSQSPRRPEKLPCDIHHVSVKGEKWTVLIGLLNNKPYEVFCAPQKSFELSNKYKQAIIRKNGGGAYHLDFEDFSIKNISKLLETDEHRALTRLLSISLRHGIPASFLCSQLDKSEGSVVDFSKAISRVLAKYSDEFTAKIKRTCNICGGHDIVYKDGCVECMSCNASKCG
jgi:ribonucleoside-diphosphate reductase alpha chain